MTPNIGQGANCAIEDAATLATLLNNLVDVANAKLPSDAEIEALFQRYRKIRYSRVKSIYKTSRFLVRLQARDGSRQCLGVTLCRTREICRLR
jgi:FAD dependent monooxygenase